MKEIEARRKIKKDRARYCSIQEPFSDFLSSLSFFIRDIINFRKIIICEEEKRRPSKWRKERNCVEGKKNI